jgi:hypothetical protein
MTSRWCIVRGAVTAQPFVDTRFIARRQTDREPHRRV